MVLIAEIYDVISPLILTFIRFWIFSKKFGEGNRRRKQTQLQPSSPSRRRLLYTASSIPTETHASTRTKAKNPAGRVAPGTKHTSPSPNTPTNLCSPPCISSRRAAARPRPRRRRCDRRASPPRSSPLLSKSKDRSSASSSSRADRSRRWGFTF